MQTSAAMEQQRTRDDAPVHGEMSDPHEQQRDDHEQQLVRMLQQEAPSDDNDREQEAPIDDSIRRHDECDFLDGAEHDDAQQQEQYDHYGDGDYGDEGDDFVHRRWSTEHGGGAFASSSHRSDGELEADESEHAHATLYERDYHRQGKLEYSDDDDGEDDDDDSADEELLELHFRNEHAMRWTLPTESDDRHTAPTQESMERIEANVRAAMDRIHDAKSRDDSGYSGDEHESDVNENDAFNEDEGDDNNAATYHDDEEADEDGVHDDGDEWKMGYGEDGKPFYYDIVHEAMEARWSHASSQHSGGYDDDASHQNGFAAHTDDLREHEAEDYDEEHDGSVYEEDTDGVYDVADDHRDEHRADEDQEHEHDDTAQDEEQQRHDDEADTKDTTATSANDRGLSLSYFTNSNLSIVEDEWQEAYTAKGRVYYYNRRTRESSWKKPENFVSRPQQQRSEFGTSSLFSLSRSSTLYTNVDNREHQRKSSYSIETQNFVFCSFCGYKLVVDDDAMKTHVRECQVQTFHKQNQTELYKKFEEMLCLMSEDTTLRSLHYASSFPDVKPLAVSASSLEKYKAQASSSNHGSIQDSLFLLRRQRHHSDVQSTEETAHTGLEYKENVRHVTSATQQPRRTLQRASSAASVPSSESTSTTSSRRKTSAGSANDVVGTNRSRKQAMGYTYQESETCRYCGRSFAEGRLAKHEAVCPRVFGSEGSWGRGTSAASHVPPTTPRSMSTSPFVKRSGVQSKKKTFKSTPIEKRNLELSYKEHQATLVGCPVCKRKFAPSGAQQHIAICKSVQNRPKNPIPLLKDYAIAG